MSKKQNVKPRATLAENQVALETKPLIPENVANWIYIGITIVFLALIWFARTNLFSLPFERDEGSYSYMGQLLLEGQKPYIDFYEMKLPGIFYCYAAIVGIFGKTQEAMHLGFAIVNFISAYFVWLIAKKIFNTPAAMAATVSFVILSLIKGISGFAAQAEHFVVLFSVMGIYATFLAIESGKIWQYFLAGISLGMALLVKQSGGFFAVAAGVLVILANIKPLNVSRLIKSGTAMLLGFAVIIGIFVGLIISKGAYKEMMYWTIEAAKNYVGALTWDQGMQQLSGGMRSITTGYIGFWVLAFLGVTLIWLTNLGFYKKLGISLLGRVVCVFVSVCGNIVLYWMSTKFAINPFIYFSFFSSSHFSSHFSHFLFPPSSPSSSPPSYFPPLLTSPSLQLLTTIPLDITLKWVNQPTLSARLTYSSSHIIGLGLRGENPHDTYVL